MIKDLSSIIARFKYLFRKKLKVSSEIIDLNIDDFEYPIDQTAIDQYHEVVSVDGQLPGAWSGAIHPLFLTKISWKISEGLNELLEEAIDGRILDTIVHQSEDITIERPLPGPCLLDVRSEIWRIDPHTKGTKMTLRLQYYLDNELMATQFSTGLFYGVQCIGHGRKRGDMPDSLRTEGPAIWKTDLPVDARLPYEYAQKAKIDAPIHTDPIFAKRIGLPNIILQGTCTLAKSVNLLLNTRYGDRPLKIKRISAKFTGMVVPPASLTVRMLTSEQDLVCFDVINQAGEGIIRGGRVVL